MNYYLDFDNTLYNTSELIEAMFDSIVSSAKKQKLLKQGELYEELKRNFTNNYIPDIYQLSEYIADKYNLALSPIVDKLNCTILNGKSYVYNDVIPFLESLKINEHNVYLLSYCKNLQYQALKISGSGLSNFFDAIYITSIPKYKLDIDYTNGIFIDDNPDDLLGLYSKNPIQVIRLRRKDNRHSIKNIDNSNIKEYIDLGGLIWKEKKS